MFGSGNPDGENGRPQGWKEKKEHVENKRM